MVKLVFLVKYSVNYMIIPQRPLLLLLVLFLFKTKNLCFFFFRKPKIFLRAYLAYLLVSLYIIELGCARLVRFPDPLLSRKWVREGREGRTGGRWIGRCGLLLRQKKQNTVLMNFNFGCTATAIVLPVIFIYGGTEKHKYKKHHHSVL